MSGPNDVHARRAAAAIAAALVGGGLSWALLGSDDGAPARGALDGRGTSAALPPESPSPALEPAQDAPEPRERVREIAALGARLPESAARDTLRALARDALDRVERGAAISALWAGGDREFLEELAASGVEDAAFVRAKLATLAERER